MSVPGDDFSHRSSLSFSSTVLLIRIFAHLCTSVEVPPQHFDPILDYFTFSDVLRLVLLSDSSDYKIPLVCRGLGGRLKGAQTRAVVSCAINRL